MPELVAGSGITLSENPTTHVLTVSASAVGGGGGGVTPQSLGAVGDGTTNDAVALQAWLDTGGDLFLPAGHYYSAAKLIIRKCVRINGASYGFDARLATYGAMPGSRIRFAAGVGGFDIQPQVSTTNWASTTPTQEGAYNSVIRDIALIGPDTGAAATGLYCRTLVHLENIWIINFQGKGFDISASLGTTDAGEGVGYSEYGNASYSTLRDCHAWSCGSHGFHIRGYDANTILVDNCDASSNIGIGFYDESLIGNTYLKTHCIGNSGGDIKAIRTHLNVFVHPYVEGGGTVAIGGNNVVLGTDFTGSNTAAGNSPLILAPATSTFNQIKFQWSYAPGASAAGTGVMYRHASYGTVMQGIPDGGGSGDVALFNQAGNPAVFVPANTQGLIGNGKIVSQSATGGIGYGGGAGGSVTQVTSKATGVTINKVCGAITMHNAALAAAAKVSFIVTNSTVLANDTIVVAVASGGTANAYRAAVTAVSGAGGAFTITVENITAGSLSEAPVINFALVKAVIT